MMSEYSGHSPELLPVQIGNAPPTMSSREIAELVEARHDSVKRTIERLAEKGVVDLPPLVEYLDSLGRKATEYRVGKRDSYVIVAQLSPEFTARLVDRWQELENAVRAAPLDYSDPQVLLGVMSHLQDQVAAKDEVIAQQGHRLAKLDRIEGAVGNLTITEAAKVLKVKPRFLTRFLHESRWIYKRPNTGHWLAYQSLIPKHLDHRDHTYKDDDGEVHFVTYAVVTPAGMVKLAAMLEAQADSDKEGV